MEIVWKLKESVKLRKITEEKNDRAQIEFLTKNPQTYSLINFLGVIKVGSDLVDFAWQNHG
jgi:hypothetical protein